MVGLKLYRVSSDKIEEHRQWNTVNCMVFVALKMCLHAATLRQILAGK